MPTTSNFGWTTPADTDLVKDGAAAIRTLGNGIDTSLVDLKGGTTGQILSKNSNTDLDYIWINNDQGDITAVTAGTGLTGGGTTGAVTLTNDMATTITAKGDLLVGTGNATYDNLAVGTNGYTLVADSSTATGLKWAAPAGGKVLQVISSTTTTSTNISSTSLTDTGITATITPTANTSTILVLVTFLAQYERSTTATFYGGKLLRGATTLLDYGASGLLGININGGNQVYHKVLGSMSYLDSPATTSSTTYKLQARIETSDGSLISFQNGSSPSTITLMEIGA